MVQLVECPPKFKRGASNFQALHLSVFNLFLLWNFLLVVFAFAYMLVIHMHEQDIKTEMNPILNPRAAGPEGSLIGIPGTLFIHPPTAINRLLLQTCVLLFSIIFVMKKLFLNG